MRVAIVGSRDFPDLDRVRETVRSLAALPRPVTVISGGARGVDAVAEETARECGYEVVVYRADWSKGRGAGLARNSLIVRDCERMVAFWNGWSRGTRDAILKARALHRDVTIIPSDEDAAGAAARLLASLRRSS